MINKYGENIHESIYKSQGNKNQPRQIKEEELHQKKTPPCCKNITLPESPGHHRRGFEGYQVNEIKYTIMDE